MEEIRETLVACDQVKAWRLYRIHCGTADNVTAEAHYLGGRAALRLKDLHETRWAMERAFDAGPLARAWAAQG